MLMQKKDNRLMILDGAKLVTVNNVNNIESLPNKKIVAIKGNNSKKYVNVKKFSWSNNFHKSYSFLEKKVLIEKLELNFGSLLSLNNITDMSTDQYPLFNINYKNIVLMDKNLQNIYIKYFLRLILPYEMLDIIVDEKDFDKLIKKIEPKIIIPVHTENSEWFKKYENCEIICDRNIIKI